MFREVDTNQMMTSQQTQDRLSRLQQEAERDRLAHQVDDKASKNNKSGLLATAMTVVSTALLSGS